MDFFDEELDFLEIQDLLLEKQNILQSEQPDEDRLAEIQRILSWLY